MNPAKTILCVGGPWDGRRIVDKPGTNELIVRTKHDYQHEDEKILEHKDTVKLDAELPYRYVKVRFFIHTKTTTIWLYESQSSAMAMLIENYQRPKSVKPGNNTPQLIQELDEVQLKINACVNEVESWWFASQTLSQQAFATEKMVSLKNYYDLLNERFNALYIFEERQNGSHNY